MRYRIYYGWFVVAACFAVTMCLGEVMWSFGVFFKALEQDFGWGRGLTSSSYTLMAVGYGISAVVFGRLCDRYSARAILLTSAIVAGSAIALCSTVDSIAQLQGLLFITGLGAGALIPVPTATAQRWFENRSGNGIALGLTMAGVGIGAVIFAPLLNLLILNLGWKVAFMVAGGIYFSILGSAAIVIRPPPRPRCDTPFRARMDASGATSPPMVARHLMRTPQFVIVVGIMVISTFGFQILTVHLVPYATDAGVSRVAAAAALGLTGAVSVPGRLLSGVLSERIGWGKTLAMAQFGMGASLVVLALVHSEWPLYLTVAVYGFCQGSRAVSVLGVLGRVYGMRVLGELTGVMIAAAHGFGSLGPYLAGHLFDRFGSYSLTFIPLGAAIALSSYGALRLEVAARRSAGVD